MLTYFAQALAHEWVRSLSGMRTGGAGQRVIMLAPLQCVNQRSAANERYDSLQAVRAEDLKTSAVIPGQQFAT